jgi:hypothetical protein
MESTLTQTETAATRGLLTQLADGTLPAARHVEGTLLVDDVLTAAGGIKLGAAGINGELIETCVAQDVEVDLELTTKQALFTVPAGYTFVHTKTLFHTFSKTTDADVAGGVGQNANCDDFNAAVELFACTAATAVQVAATDGKQIVAAAAVVGLKLGTKNDTAATALADVFGYLKINL